MKNTVICSKEQYVYFASASYEGKEHDKAIATEENLVFHKSTAMWADLGYLGFEAVNLTLHLPHKKPRKTDLTELQKKYNTQHAKERETDARFVMNMPSEVLNDYESFRNL